MITAVRRLGFVLVGPAGSEFKLRVNPRYAPCTGSLSPVRLVVRDLKQRKGEVRGAHCSTDRRESVALSRTILWSTLVARCLSSRSLREHARELLRASSSLEQKSGADSPTVFMSQRLTQQRSQGDQRVKYLPLGTQNSPVRRMGSSVSVLYLALLPSPTRDAEVHLL